MCVEEEHRWKGERERKADPWGRCLAGKEEEDGRGSWAAAREGKKKLGRRGEEAHSAGAR